MSLAMAYPPTAPPAIKRGAQPEIKNATKSRTGKNKAPNPLKVIERIFCIFGRLFHIIPQLFGGGLFGAAGKGQDGKTK